MSVGIQPHAAHAELFLADVQIIVPIHSRLDSVPQTESARPPSSCFGLGLNHVEVRPDSLGLLPISHVPLEPVDALLFLAAELVTGAVPPIRAPAVRPARVRVRCSGLESPHDQRRVLVELSVLRVCPRALVIRMVLNPSRVQRRTLLLDKLRSTMRRDPSCRLRGSQFWENRYRHSSYTEVVYGFSH